MTLQKLSPGQTVFSVDRHKMGNTSILTTSISQVMIKSINIETETVNASKNGNPARVFHKKVWSKWRKEEPLLIGNISQRLATREETKAHKEKEESGKTLISRESLISEGYDPETSETTRFFKKARNTRSRSTRTVVRVNLKNEGNADVSATDTPRTEDGVSGFNSSKELTNLKQLREWEEFSFGSDSSED